MSALQCAAAITVSLTWAIFIGLAAGLFLSLPRWSEESRQLIPGDWMGTAVAGAMPVGVAPVDLRS